MPSKGDITCNCSGCVSRRLAQQKWEEKNKEKRMKRQKERNKLRREELVKSRLEVSDEELDRRMGL